MAKRLTDKDKKEIIQEFTEGKNLNELPEKFNCTKLTISRNLKKSLGMQTYKDFKEKNILKKQSTFVNENNNSDNNKLINKDTTFTKTKKETIYYERTQYYESIPVSTFIEIAPINNEIDTVPQKDLASIPISDMNFPKIVYMIVDNKIELETKLLNEYSEWHFLSKEDLNRKTLKIYYELKIAKRDCNKDQKVIKIPNPNVFKIVAPILRSRGISRIVSVDNLIAL